MSETDATPPTEPDDAAIEAEVAELTASPADQQADKVKHALIAAKRDLRTSNRRVKELEPMAAHAERVQADLDRAMPIITAVNANPKLLAEALRMTSGGTRVSADTTDQPIADDDPDAAALAEIRGYYLADQATPDVARARRELALLDRRTGRQTDERIRPLAGVTLGQKAETNIARAIAETDDDGVPLATEESIREVVAQFGASAQMLADPKIVDVVLNSAIGIDKRKRRTPKPVADPLYLEAAGGGRRRDVSSGIDRSILERVGLTEDDIKATTKKIEQSGGKSVVMGR